MTATVRDVYDCLQARAPFETAAVWDHVGLQVGDFQETVIRALVCLDVTEAAIRQATEQQVQLMISHHPPLFAPLHTLRSESVPYRLAAAGISVLSAHTNLDVAAGGVNDCLCEAIGLVGTTPIADGFGRVGVLSSPCPVREFADRVKQKLGTSLRIHEGTSEIYRVAVVSGAGGEFLADVRETVMPDAFITGEIKHHEWLNAGDITVIDAGHYATEQVVVRPLTAWLSEQMPNVEFTAFDGEAPYQTR